MHQWPSSLGIPADQLPSLWCNSLRESGNEIFFLCQRRHALFPANRECCVQKRLFLSFFFLFLELSLGPHSYGCWELCFSFSSWCTSEREASRIILYLSTVLTWYAACEWVRNHETLSIDPIMRKNLRRTLIGSQVWVIGSKLVLSRNPRWLALIQFLELVKTFHSPFLLLFREITLNGKTQQVEEWVLGSYKPSRHLGQNCKDFKERQRECVKTLLLFSPNLWPVLLSTPFHIYIHIYGVDAVIP